MFKAIGMSVARHVLTGVGAVFVSKGFVDASTADAIMGGIIAASGLAWSWVDKAAHH